MQKNTNSLFDLEQVKLFLLNVPEDRMLLAQTMFEKLDHLNNTIAKLQKLVDKDVSNAGLLKSYNNMLMRYGVLCKQLAGILPKSKDDLSNDPLINFINGTGE